MAQNNTFKRYLDAGAAFMEMPRKRAENIVKEAVKAGELQRKQAQQAVDDLLDRSRKNTEQLVDLVRREITTQLSTLGVATKDDIARLESRLASLSGPKPVPGAPVKAQAKTAPAKKTPPAKKTAPAKKAVAEKAAPATEPAAPATPEIPGA
jgi:polyhydroxyalkanoate synthesis regulator phasin